MKLHATKMPKFVCTICKDSFDTNDELKKHLEDHAEADRLDHLKAQQVAQRQQPKIEPGLKSEPPSSSSSSSSSSKGSKKATADAISSFAESVLANDDDVECKFQRFMC